MVIGSKVVCLLVKRFFFKVGGFFFKLFVVDLFLGIKDMLEVVMISCILF